MKLVETQKMSAIIRKRVKARENPCGGHYTGQIHDSHPTEEDDNMDSIRNAHNHSSLTQGWVKPVRNKVSKSESHNNSPR